MDIENWSCVQSMATIVKPDMLIKFQKKLKTSLKKGEINLEI